ncbi:MAG: hypothetical protein K9I68_01550 [Bacteroidales bacterium]|nr:hypothetical protein [Bacteroidales bacterium]MCF8337072.1 hypothetical protein [Bacteroidales bacterium]
MIRKSAMYNKNTLALTIIFILLIIGYGCKNTSQRSQAIQEKVKQYHHKKILLPFSDSVLYNNAMIPVGQTNLKKGAIKVSTYIDGQCGSCLKTLTNWKPLISLAKKHHDFQILFYVYAFSRDEFIQYYYPESIHEYPVMFDTQKKYLKRNELSEYEDYKTFLLNGDNEVTLVGNPARSEKLMALYEQEIIKRLNAADQ